MQHRSLWQFDFLALGRGDGPAGADQDPAEDRTDARTGADTARLTFDSVARVTVPRSGYARPFTVI